MSISYGSYKNDDLWLEVGEKQYKEMEEALDQYLDEMDMDNWDWDRD